MNVFVLLYDKDNWLEKWYFPKTFYKEDKDEFKRLNAVWYWVYKTVNAFDCTDEELQKAIDEWKWKTKRQIQFLKKLKFVYADIDIAKKWDWQTREEKEFKKNVLLEALKAYCEPTMCIDTSNWIQPLRRIDEDKIDAQTQEKYVNVINWIIARSRQFGWMWDQVKDVTRVVRMPWYYHMKEEPYMVTIQWWWILNYSLDELAIKFPFEWETSRQYKKIDDSELTLQFQEVNNIPLNDLVSKAMRAVWRSFEIDKQWRRIIDWRLTWNFNWKTGWDFVGSTSHEDFSWNKITSLSKILWLTYSETFKWIKDEFNIRPESELRIKKTPLLKKELSANSPRPFAQSWLVKFSTGIDEIDWQVWHIWSGELVLLHWPSKNGKTFVAISLLNKNANMWNKWALFSIEMDREHLKTQQALARAWIDRLSYENWSYTTSQRDLFCEFYEWFDANFTIFDENDLPPDLKDEWFTLEYLCSQIRKLHKDEGYTCFAIDSLKLILWWAWKNENQRQWIIVRQLMNLKKELPIAIVLIHHNEKSGWTFSWSQDLENFVDWRIEVKKKIDPDANWDTIFNNTIIRVYKERIGKELEFLFNWVKWKLIFVSSWFIEYKKKTDLD